ncbi:ferritin-like domain-containing protein [Campylobacter sp. VTCC 70190]|uniref:ferritin-like domain-containing protein n=1 Tax=Campylobacter sp. VTCC 70190 TaxID=3392118 RepID=UPI00398E337B
MQKEFFKELENILYHKDIAEKFYNFTNFYEDFKSDNFIFNHEGLSIFKKNTNPTLSVAHPTRIRRPKLANSTQALAKIIHSIAHIEFSAINLALDASYRFKNLPLQFYKDWLEVADEEIKHFELLNSALEELGYKYGDFVVHDNLEAALEATKHSLSFRMGVVHRGLEAKGLDANPYVVKKLQSSDHSIKKLLIEYLDIILNDEIKHVAKGDTWWNFANEDKYDFIELCKKFKQFSLAGKKLNTEARMKAGFKQEECEELEKLYS